MSSRPGPDQRRRTWIWRWAGPAVALIVLLLVFAAYLRPAMMMQMAQQIWSCF